VADVIPRLLGDPERLARMGSAASGLMRSDADEALARMVLAAAAS
jgi:UDP-N-acetylglucosamine--N-acetylmuramyl-(pentapeptide) pyrophosphoryl-undecaprenol N-acetylglucosamine transferase